MNGTFLNFQKRLFRRNFRERFEFLMDHGLIDKRGLKRLENWTADEVERAYITGSLDGMAEMGFKQLPRTKIGKK